MIHTLVLASATAVFLPLGAMADTLKIAVTTSFHNSGLSDILLPEIKKDTGLDVQLLVVGTGQALRLGQAGDVDAILVHSRSAEEEFLAKGYGTHRREIMYNDFVIIGPLADPAGLDSATSISDAMGKMANTEVAFVSRGDNSGTHKKEMSLWSAAQLNSESFDNWYNAVGAGMGAALNTAAGMNGYIMSDRASWLNFGNKAGLAILFERDPTLFNQYAYIPVNPEMHPHVKNDLANQLEDWLVSGAASELINDYKINGETLFTFNAKQ